MRCCGLASVLSRTVRVTPRPQIGNPRPRLFRSGCDEAVINRLGFNNEGEAAVLRRLAARASRGGIVAINIGANRDPEDRTADYVRLVEAFAPVVSYIILNVSSPNTPGLRNLQEAKKSRRSSGARDRGAQPRASSMLVQYRCF